MATEITLNCVCIIHPNHSTCRFGSSECVFDGKLSFEGEENGKIKTLTSECTTGITCLSLPICLSVVAECILNIYIHLCLYINIGPRFRVQIWGEDLNLSLLNSHLQMTVFFSNIACGFRRETILPQIFSVWKGALLFIL